MYEDAWKHGFNFKLFQISTIQPNDRNHNRGKSNLRKINKDGIKICAFVIQPTQDCLHIKNWYQVESTSNR